jgi:hypothetical protein
MHTLKFSSKSRNQQRAGFAAGSGNNNNQIKAPKTASEKKEKGKGRKKAHQVSVQTAALSASRITGRRVRYPRRPALPPTAHRS